MLLKEKNCTISLNYSGSSIRPLISEDKESNFPLPLMPDNIRFFQNPIRAMITIIRTITRTDIPTDNAIILFLVCVDV